MQVISGTYHDGQVVLDHEVDWPDGLRIDLFPATTGDEHSRENQAAEEVRRIQKRADCADGEWNFMTDDDWPTTPEGIRALVASMEACEPLVFSPEEEARIDQAMREYEDFNRQAMVRNAKELETLF